VVAFGGESSPPGLSQRGRVGSAGDRLEREVWGLLEEGESSRIAVVVLVAAGGIAADVGAGVGLCGGRIEGVCVCLVAGMVGAEAVAAAAAVVAVAVADFVGGCRKGWCRCLCY